MGNPEWRFREAQNRNKTFFHSLTRAMDMFGKEALVTASAGALEVAMRTTVADSSRAAMNWDIEVNGANPYGRGTDELHPAEYHTMGIGGKGDAGAQIAIVSSKKRQKYGYTVQGGLSVKDGWLRNMIKPGSFSRPTVRLFNPILTMYPKYAKHAFFPDAEMHNVVVSGDNGWRIDVKNQAEVAVFALVKQVNNEIRKGTLRNFVAMGYNKSTS